MIKSDGDRLILGLNEALYNIVKACKQFKVEPVYQMQVMAMLSLPPYEFEQNNNLNITVVNHTTSRYFYIIKFLQW